MELRASVRGGGSGRTAFLSIMLALDLLFSSALIVFSPEPAIKVVMAITGIVAAVALVYQLVRERRVVKSGSTDTL